jgi:hypothetical protein
MGKFIENVVNPDGYRLRDLQLELSLKPFYDNSAATREAVCREIFMQWQALWRHAERISILLWVGEGSEILEYDGNPDTAFEWARYHGAPNRHRWELSDKSVSEDADHNGIGIDVGARDPEQKGIHCRAYLYRDNPAVFTYGWLAGLVSDLKRIGESMTGLPVLVGQGFDIGPEFAKSRFKFDWHREILGDGPVFKEQFISCEAVLKADDRCYGAYPHGIPEGLAIGEFLGRQTRALFDACGHDFLWLSNGFGFALEPWAMVGRIFDGEGYHPRRVADTSRRILDFWDKLRLGLGREVNLRTRGTNMATGIDIGSDASPLKQIYDNNPVVDAPVNSPWAALDGDFGLELSGWMSHMAVHPGETYRYRFYTHDPWWLNSPWLDRYARQPHDLYLPLSVSRLEEDGAVEIPRDLAFLTIDDSHGCMPLAVPNEVAAYFLRARERAPDELGPLVWIYPFDEFHHLGLEAGQPERPFHADSFIGEVINAGVPLNSVADAGHLEKSLLKNPRLVEGRLFFAPVPRPGSAYEELILKLRELKADLLFFGPLFPDSFLWDVLGLASEEPLSGDFVLQEADQHAEGKRIRHLDMLSSGGWREAPATGNPEAFGVSISGLQEDTERIAFRFAGKTGGGRTGWLRGSLATGEFDPDDPRPVRGPILKPVPDPAFALNGELARRALHHFGWDLDHVIAEGDAKRPYLTIHRHANAAVFSGYHRNEGSAQIIRTPLGAPLMTGKHNRIHSGQTRVSGEVAWQYESRVFFIEGEDGTIRCRDLIPAMHGVHRRMLVSGLDRARLRILPDPAHLESFRLLPDPKFPYFQGTELPVRIVSEAGHLVAETPPLSGELLVEW